MPFHVTKRKGGWRIGQEEGRYTLHQLAPYTGHVGGSRGRPLPPWLPAVIDNDTFSAIPRSCEISQGAEPLRGQRGGARPGAKQRLLCSRATVQLQNRFCCPRRARLKHKNRIVPYFTPDQQGTNSEIHHEGSNSADSAARMTAELLSHDFEL